MPKITYYKNSSDQCIASVVLVPENGKWRIFVGWEYEDSIKRGHVKFYASRDLYHHNQINLDMIDYACDYGIKVFPAAIRKVFPAYLINAIEGKEEQDERN